MDTRRPDPILFLSDARGIYIPRDFAASIVRDCVTGVDPDDWLILEAGPDHEAYWDVWADVESNALVTDPTTGIVYRVYQDGDCWLIPDGMTLDERRGFAARLAGRNAGRREDPPRVWGRSQDAGRCVGG